VEQGPWLLDRYLWWMSGITSLYDRETSGAATGVPGRGDEEKGCRADGTAMSASLSPGITDRATKQHGVRMG